MQLPLNVSPVSASFFGLQRLGIHLVLCNACFTVRSLTIPHTLETLLAWLRLQTTRPSCLCSRCASRLFSALGKIEVILPKLYFCNAVVNVPCQESLTTGKWKHNRLSRWETTSRSRRSVCGELLPDTQAHQRADRPGMGSRQTPSMP